LRVTLKPRTLVWEPSKIKTEKVCMADGIHYIGVSENESIGASSPKFKGEAMVSGGATEGSRRTVTAGRTPKKGEMVYARRPRRFKCWLGKG